MRAGRPQGLLEASGVRLGANGQLEPGFARQIGSCIPVPGNPSDSRIRSGSLCSRSHGSTTMAIAVPEARALVRGVQALVSRHGLSACRLLAIVDNVATCLAFGRRRSRDKRIFLRIRKLNAWRLARRISLSASGSVRGQSGRQAIPFMVSSDHHFSLESVPKQATSVQRYEESSSADSFRARMSA